MFESVKILEFLQRKQFCLFQHLFSNVVCRLSVAFVSLLKPFDGFRCHFAGTLHFPGPLTLCVRWGP